MSHIDIETDKIISTYQRIYSVIFRYGIFILLGVASFGVVLSLSPEWFNDVNIGFANNPIAKTSPFIKSGSVLIAKGVTLTPAIDTTPIHIDIIQGFIDNSPEAQMGYSILGQRKGMILPISLNLIKHDDNFSKEYFSSSEYKPEELDMFIKNTIMTYPVKNIQAMIYQYKKQTAENTINFGSVLARPFPTEFTRSPLPTLSANEIASEVTLKERFGLSCLWKRHLTSFFCYKNTAQFVSRIPYLSFENKLDELGALMQQIMRTPYKDAACNNLQSAFSKSAMADRKRETIFMLCGANYLQAYKRIVDFAMVTYELQGISNAKLYNDNDVNIFKLLSLQQKIYHNTLQKNYDIGTIEIYLTFVQDLLVKRPNIDQVYKDIIYLYNNTHLKAALTQIAILNNNAKVMLRLTDVIKNINESKPTELQSKISNPELVAYVNNTKWPSVSQPGLVTFQDLFASKFTTFDNFVVTNQKVNNTTLSAEVEGYFILRDEGEEEKKVLFVGNYTYAEETFTLVRATFPQSQYLGTMLNKLIKTSTTPIDIAFVYEFVKNNNGNASKAVSLCDVIEWGAYVPNECSDTSARFIQNETTITFAFNGYRITSVTTNVAATTVLLRQKLTGVITTQNNIASIIEELIGLTKEDESAWEPTQSTWSILDTNEFTIISKFKKFLQVTPEKITMSEWKYLVEFIMDDTTFIAAVDIKNNYKLSPVVIKQWEEYIRINNFSLNLTNVSLSEINQFVTDPSEFIRKLDAEVHEKAYSEQ